MIEEYYKYKIEYKEYIILIKSGNFYEILDKDAIILNKLLNYKLSKLSDTVKCGFPISSLEKVKIILKDKKINYIVVEKDIIVCKEQFENNTYSNYKYDINTIKYNFIRIGKITKYLNENAYENINDLLNEIEVIINGRR
jgi:hypothetical protein